MEVVDTDVTEYLAGLPEDVHDDMVALDRSISKVMHGLPRELWMGKFWGGSDQEIVGYGRISYARSGGDKVEWFTVGLARQKNYISVYISAVENGAYLAETYGKDLGKVKVGKSNISFDSVRDIDLEKLEALVAKAREINH